MGVMCGRWNGMGILGFWVGRRSVIGKVVLVVIGMRSIVRRMVGVKVY